MCGLDNSKMVHLKHNDSIQAMHLFQCNDAHEVLLTSFDLHLLCRIMIYAVVVMVGGACKGHSRRHRATFLCMSVQQKMLWHLHMHATNVNPAAAAAAACTGAAIVMVQKPTNKTC